MQSRHDQKIDDALLKLKTDIPLVTELLKIGHPRDVAAWTHVVEGKLLTRLSSDFPLMATICGGGSSGKSTLFNSLLGQRLSPVGGSAGINRRVLISAHETLVQQKDFLSSLFEPFGCLPEPLKNPDDLTVAGPPSYALSDVVPRNIVLMDTPDFDTGSKGVYVNREISEQALEASDILIYIFTNSNYNNRDNTDFISQMLTGIGMRKCFLVYRVYPSFKSEEVRDHAMTVARNLYGPEAEQYVLGIYRTDEDNAVAGGESFMELRPVRNEDPSFLNALKAIDSQKIRLELLASILNDVVGKAQEILEAAKISKNELALYLDTFQTAQSHCVHEALQHFPMDRVMKRFVEIWLTRDPPHVKFMRKTGRKKLTETRPGDKAADSAADLNDKVGEDLLNAVNNMHYGSVGTEISVSASVQDPVARRMFDIVEQIRAGKSLDGTQKPRVEISEKTGTYTFFVSAHPAVVPAQEKLRDMDWKAALQSILARRNVLTELSQGIENDLNLLADDFRSRMDVMSKVRQTFSALLNVLPATAAVTYILTTGDPVGATGIKVKLTGLFGLHDLYALVAIPATTGMKSADQKQLEVVLAPIVETWLNNKFKTVQALFEAEISGEIIQTAKTAIADSEKLIEDIQTHIETCGRVMAS
ncbi:MAG: dynamin family protein [Deltaproteobacteria bacterium]|nr:dynamin family protein [Deltaproteobacteria bacterium]